MDLTLRLTQLSELTGIKRHTLNARLKASFDNKDLVRNSGNQIALTPQQTNHIIKDHINGVNGRVLYIGNLKGGVGKTTLSYLLATAAASLGLKTCVLDLDVQANLTRQFTDVKTEQSVFFDVIEKKRHIKDVIISISETLDIIPSSLKNSLIERALTVQSPKHQLNWFNSICLDYLRKHYQIIIVDTPPHLTTLNSVFCLCLSSNDHILVPVCAEEFSVMGVNMFLEDIKEIKKSYGVENSDIGISLIMNRFFQQQKTNLEMLVKMGNTFDGLLSETIIRDNAKIREIMSDKLCFSQIKQGKEIYSVICAIFKELKILRGEA